MQFKIREKSTRPRGAGRTSIRDVHGQSPPTTTSYPSLLHWAP